MVSNSMKVLGLMSGTSLDGLDLALVEFTEIDGKYAFEFIRTKAVPYSAEWSEKLKNSRFISAPSLLRLNKDYGVLLAKEILSFGIQDVDLIASHGHTVFHQPENGFTLQIGDLNQVANLSRITTVGDFRSMDVAKGGQGAPLVPIGDQLLFSGYDSCLNLGGISNVSFTSEQEIKARDLSACNIVANYLANQIGYSYDDQGKIGRSGALNINLEKKLSEWSFYQNAKSSLGIEDIEKDFLPIFEKIECSVPDKLHTFYRHISKVIAGSLSGSTYCTGGGVKNSFLMELLELESKSEIIVPSEKMIDFKEALIFAFLGFLRIRNEVNTLSSVTGASSDSSSGVVVNI